MAGKRGLVYEKGDFNNSSRASSVPAGAYFLR